MQGLLDELRDIFFIRDNFGYSEFRDNQPFSQAGQERGFDDPRGTVIFKIMEIVSIKKPAIVFLENVPNLLRHNGGKTYKTIQDYFEKEYDLSTAVLDSAYFGVPQSRPRVYIVALRKKGLLII